MNMGVFDRIESEVRSYIRSFPTVFSTAKGAEIVDEAGRRYLDFFSGAGSLNYGHNNPLIKRELKRYIDQDGIVHGLDMATSRKRLFMETFEELILTPRGMNYKLQFTGPTGTNAVEAAMKLARLVTGRQNIICFTNAFHGVTLGAMAATGNQKFREAAGTTLQGTTFLPYDGYLGPTVDTTVYLEKILSDPSSGLDKPAAVMIETVQGEGGVNVASTPWLKSLEQLCRRHEILLIVDDIQVGCGRTGRFFSFEDSGISPDIITLSKSLSGYGLPMAMVLMKPEFDLWKPGVHNGTFRGNNMAFVTAREALTNYWSDSSFEKETLIKGQQMHLSLSETANRHRDEKLEVRGRGMIQALAFSHHAQAQEVANLCFQRGLIIESSGAHSEVLKLLPPLTISSAELDKGLSIIERAVHVVINAARYQVRRVK